ncbi:GH43 family beta-xylosidase [Haloferula luteola]|uniref:GH43 family beta-xylosidase n=1 Tax=Haloferula luteola TaxID=595692 RepID=A0A840UZN4_9BACT|nr:family 43 glycosylhydrolase [Haloferula luteola]MBB5351205.1 GH43 family beta-xylosidase [Haloferula luteola]
MLNPRIALLTLVGTLAVHAAPTITNPIGEGADPWLTREGDQYVWCQSEGNRGVSLWLADHPGSLGTRHVVWMAPESGPFSKEVWAPEAHFIDGHWYIYFAADDGNNANHLAYALASKGKDPLGPYELHGPFATGEGPDGKSPNIWAIDMTVLELDGKQFAIWSGWDAPGTDRQYLYIAPMKSPVELSGPRVLLCDNADYLWERTEETATSRGLNEGPQILQHDGRTFVVYSCGASWDTTYKLGMLELTGEDPLDPAAWTKFPEPVFRSTEDTFGVGHGSFVTSPDGSEWWHVYHAKRSRNPGWQRAIFAQPFTFTPEGLPDFGQPVVAGSSLPLPSGATSSAISLPFRSNLREKDALEAFAYYGHQQFITQEKDGVHLGVIPAAPVNDYRCGEKLVLRGGDLSDFKASVDIAWVHGERDAGLLFRITEPTVGFDAQKGYFAGILPGQNRVILGKTDGKNWTELAASDLPKKLSGKATLGVTAQGNQLTVSVDGKTLIDFKDDSWSHGSVGLRVVDTHASFHNFSLSKP